MIKAVNSQSIVYVGRLLHDPMAEGDPVKRQDGAALNPHLTRHVIWFGDYVVILHGVLPLIMLFSCSKLLTQIFSNYRPRDAR
jgi:hypothetical protein